MISQAFAFDEGRWHAVTRCDRAGRELADCRLAFNVGIGGGLSTKSYRCPVGGCELFVMPGSKWRFGGRINSPERENADAARARARREQRQMFSEE